MTVAAKLPRAVRIIRKEDKILFLNPDVPAWLVSNRNGAIAIALCNGKRTIDEVAALFGSRYGQEHVPEVRRFLGQIQTSRIFADQPKPARHQLSDYRLRILQLSLTSQCNLQCTYCYATDRTTDHGSSLTLAEYQQVIDDAVRLASELQIVLTGGEPLLNPECLAIAEHAKQSNCQVHLLTNGILINSTNVSRISELFFLVKISVDGSTKELHELHRGTNSYDRTLRAVSLLDAAGANYQISMTVTRSNIHDVAAMARQYGSRLTFAPVFDAGRARGGSNCITGGEYYSALAAAWGVNPFSELDSLLESSQRQKVLKCAMGDAELSISETGDVYPCQLLHAEQFCAGNVRTRPLGDIYSDSQVIRTCRQLTVDNVKGCSECVIRYICGGACRARAFYECGDVCSSGRFCEYEKRAIINGLFDTYSKNALQTPVTLVEGS